MHPAARECPHVWCPAVQEEMRTPERKASNLDLKDMGFTMISSSQVTSYQEMRSCKMMYFPYSKGWCKGQNDPTSLGSFDSKRNYCKHLHIVFFANCQ